MGKNTFSWQKEPQTSEVKHKVKKNEMEKFETDQYTNI